MGYIRVPELDNLLRLNRALQEMLKELKNQIELIKHDGKDDEIYGRMTNRNFNGMPGSGQIADKTAKIAMTLPSVSSEGREAIQKVKSEIYLVSIIVDKLELAKRLLSRDEQDVIQLRYDKGLTFQEMAVTMKTGKGQIKLKHGHALERMVQACRIEQVDYKKVLRIMKG